MNHLVEEVSHLDEAYLGFAEPLAGTHQDSFAIFEFFEILQDVISLFFRLLFFVANDRSKH